MKTKIQKWGNSLAVRIPKPVAEEIGLTTQSDVEMSLQHGSLVLTPTRRPYALEDLVKDITPANRHDEIDLGPPMGRELL
ncbi:MAG TPA: AbrB/MazE/SpoVT family DNA-binding domain-containing protein [Thermoanaerobaculia bacterium]|jgi:antitoxin MazE|nr:AbrB/MazE/SpoVT family DNA-binding domain-containing protein [Thermoanaerobaculia bacterium]